MICGSMLTVIIRLFVIKFRTIMILIIVIVVLLLSIASSGGIVRLSIAAIGILGRCIA